MVIAEESNLWMFCVAPMPKLRRYLTCSVHANLLPSRESPCQLRKGREKEEGMSQQKGFQLAHHCSSSWVGDYGTRGIKFKAKGGRRGSKEALTWLSFNGRLYHVNNSSFDHIHKPGLVAWRTKRARTEPSQATLTSEKNGTRKSTPRKQGRRTKRRRIA
jgi:hypothetical protein